MASLDSSASASASAVAAGTGSGSAGRYAAAVVEGSDTVHARLLAMSGTGKRVLELGCATGYVSAALKARGHYVDAVEIDEAAASAARAFADRVVVADLDRERLAALFAGQRYDVVMAGDVLEHLRDPVRVLRDAADLLAVDGHIVLSIPNVAYHDVRLALLSGDWTYHATGILDATHVRFLTRASLWELVGDAGLVVTELDRYDKPPGTSNVAGSIGPLGNAVADIVALDPNAATYVFVVKVEPPGPASSERAAALERSLIEAERAAAMKLTDSAQALQRSRGAQAELDALHATRTMRALRIPRELYRRLRR
jgi:2-polyprenyl-3-methyl-5-hydroxy-6-metoxy-1,4-benzoquinol methylase